MKQKRRLLEVGRRFVPGEDIVFQDLSIPGGCRRFRFVLITPLSLQI
jgi:hypothetical protein